MHNNTDIGIIAFCPLHLENMCINQSLQDYESTIFGIPKLLQYALDKNLLFVLVPPEEINHLSPLDVLSSSIESARVALALTSAYFRFHALDVKIITVPNKWLARYTKDSSLYSDISEFVEALALKKINDHKNFSPEDQIKQRIFAVEYNLLQEKSH